MLADIGSFMVYTVLVMTGLIGLGVLGGHIIARVRMRRFMKAFKGD